MKKIYEKPILVVDIIEEKDIITLSIQSTGDGNSVSYNTLFE